MSSSADYAMYQSFVSSSWLFASLIVWSSSLGGLLGTVASCCPSDLAYFLFGVTGSESPLEAWRSSFYKCGIFSFCAWYWITESGPDNNDGCWKWCGLFILNPENYYKRKRVGRFPTAGCTFSEKSSCWKCSCEKTTPVYRLMCVLAMVPYKLPSFSQITFWYPYSYLQAVLEGVDIASEGVVLPEFGSYWWYDELRGRDCSIFIVRYDVADMFGLTKEIYS